MKACKGKEAAGLFFLVNFPPKPNDAVFTSILVWARDPLHGAEVARESVATLSSQPIGNVPEVLAVLELTAETGLSLVQAGVYLAARRDLLPPFMTPPPPAHPKRPPPRVTGTYEALELPKPPAVACTSCPTPCQSCATTGEGRQATAVQAQLVAALKSVMENDATRYDHHQPRARDGKPPREDGGTCWLTPRELAAGVLGRTGLYCEHCATNAAHGLPKCANHFAAEAP